MLLLCYANDILLKTVHLAVIVKLVKKYSARLLPKHACFRDSSSSRQCSQVFACHVTGTKRLTSDGQTRTDVVWISARSSPWLDVDREMTTIIVAGWVCVLLAAVFADNDNIIYKKVGDVIVFKPDVSSVAVTLKSIMWKHNKDFALQWYGSDIDYYRQFKDRGSLNTSSGMLTLTALREEDGGHYTPEINNIVGNPFHLKIISPVQEPTVSKSCNKEKTSCNLKCEGASEDAQPITYNWKIDDKVLTNSLKELNITKEGNSSIVKFRCELKNPVSLEESKPITNPLSTGFAKTHIGVAVFSVLAGSLVLLVLLHRLTAGMWFFQKNSMPWKSEFWSKTNPAKEDTEETTYHLAGEPKGD